MAIKSHDVPPELFQTLLQKHFLDDLRFARNYAAKRRGCHPSLVRTELLNAGISTELTECALTEIEWPSLPDVVRATMMNWKLQPPLHHREAARLYRALVRLGFPEDE